MMSFLKHIHKELTKMSAINISFIHKIWLVYKPFDFNSVTNLHVLQFLFTLTYF